MKTQRQKWFDTALTLLNTLPDYVKRQVGEWTIDKTNRRISGRHWTSWVVLTDPSEDVDTYEYVVDRFMAVAVNNSHDESTYPMFAPTEDALRKEMERDMFGEVTDDIWWMYIVDLETGRTFDATPRIELTPCTQ